MGHFRASGGYQEMLALKALNDVGLSVPEEIVIIGFKKLAALLPPPLTVIQPSAMQQGLLAMRFVKRPGGDEDSPRAIPLESFLVVCGRTANPGESAGSVSRDGGQAMSAGVVVVGRLAQGDPYG